MPLRRTYRKSLRPLNRSYHIRKAPPVPPIYTGAGWMMSLVMVGVTIWSAYDGERSGGMMLVASLAAVAAMNVLALAAAALPQTRFFVAVFSALWVLIYMPAWDWLARRFVFPGSVWSALGFGAAFGLIRYTMTRRGPSRPPW